MRHLLTLSALLVSFTASAEPTKPGLELRVKSVRDLSEYFEYIGGLAGQEEQGKQFAELIRVFGGAKGVIEGFDLNRPLGGYAVFSEAMVDSQFIVMLPVAEEKAFINLLKSRLSLEPKDEGEGLYKLTVPNVPPPIFFRFHERYACITILDPKHVDPKALLDPKSFFHSKDDAIATAVLHVDRIPAEFRKVMLGQLELRLHDLTKGNPHTDSLDRFGQWLLREAGLRAGKCLSDDVSTLTLRLELTPSRDDIALTAEITPRKGSDFSKTVRSMPLKPARSALAAETTAPVLALSLNAGVPDSLKKELASKIDALLKDVVASTPPGDREAVARTLDTFAPTLKAGDYEFGLAITGTPENGNLRLVAAARTMQGKDIVQLAREFSAFIPEDRAKFDFDVGTLPDGSLHKVTVLNDDLKRLYGSETIWAGLSDSLLLIGFEPDGEMLKKQAKLQTGTSDLLALRIGVARFLPLVDPALDADIRKDVEAAIPGITKLGADQLSLNIQGGDRLTVRLTLKGKAIQYLAKIDALKQAK